ncbi:MAG TPA: hypothetical protein VKG44_04765 [Candidatus Baltobacteraceae bacterium]|nr:hypothetical protein [Candidatus Baltobacteraceae bacterium]
MLAAGAAPQTPPQIRSIAATPAVVHSGEVVSWTVRTTPDVSSVTAHVTAYTIPLRRVGAGRFAVSFRIPAGVPPLFHGRYTVQVVAQTAAGLTANGSFVMDFQ